MNEWRQERHVVRTMVKAPVQRGGRRAFFGNANPLGRQLEMPGQGRPAIEIVGVARDSCTA